MRPYKEVSMTLNLMRSRQPQELRPRIIVFGVGGAGCNAVNNMIRLNLEGVECVVANTDAQALAQGLPERRIQLGLSITQGLGAGSRPEIGRAAAEEAWDEISTQLQGGHMVFITAGMGGGTGTGAAPVVARAAREQGLLTVAVVTKPFHFEGAQRMRLAEVGLTELQEVVDTVIVIPNQNLFRVANEKTTFADAFHMADQVLYSGVRGITDLMVMPGLINLDFADIRTVMGEMGKAMMGSGEAEGANRAIEAAERAISNPLLDDTSMTGARGLLINITGGPDLTLFEVDEAANRVRDEVDPQANIIFGSAFDEGLKGRIRVSVFATGIESAAAKSAKPEPARPVAVPRPQPVRAPMPEAEPVAARPVERPRPQPVPQPLVAAVRAPQPAPPPPRYVAARAEAAPRPLRVEIERTAAPLPAASAGAAAVAAAPRPAVQQQPDMFGGAHATEHEVPMTDGTSALAPQPRYEAPVRTEAARAAIVAYVDDIEPERSSPERRAHGASGHDAGGKAKPSIFNLWRSRRPDTPRLDQRAETAPTLVAGPARAAAPLPERMPRAPQSQASAEPEARRVKEEDLLEIPAFLRRQAN